MKPCTRKALSSRILLQELDYSLKSTVATIKGSTKKLGEKYKNCLVVLYNKANLMPIDARKPDENGDYRFLGLNTDLKTFIVAFDSTKQYNAVIQDNLVPK